MAVVSGALVVAPAPTWSAAQGTAAPQCPATVIPDPDILWTEVTPKAASSGPGGYQDVFFLNERQGWVVGNGEISFTTDGGLTWKHPLPSNIVDHEGKQVDPVAIAAAGWSQVRFVDEKNGWVVGAGGMLRTTDGGHRWRGEKLPHRMPTDYPELQGEEVKELAVSAVKDPPGHVPDTVLVWVAAEATGLNGDDKLPDGTKKTDKGLLFTKSTTTSSPEPWSGETWSVVNPEGPGGSNALLGPSLQFFDAGTGLAVTRLYTGDGVDSGADGAIFATSDGGRTWRLDEKNPNTQVGSNGGRGVFKELFFIDPAHGSALWYNNDANTQNWGANSNGAGGRTWENQTERDCLPSRVTVGVADGRNCAPPKEPGCNRLVTGSSPSNISRTTDGGATWVPIANPDPTPSAYARYNGLSYPTPTVAYVVGRSVDRRKIFKGSITFVKVTDVEVGGTGKAEGLLCGGTEVTITGDHFYPEDQANGYGASEVFFGTREAEVVSVDRKAETEAADDTMVVRAPPGVAPGPVDVIVKTPGLGESRPLQKQFTYLDTGLLPPVVSKVLPASGKLAGGERITITGERLGCAARVDFRDPRSGKVATVPLQPKSQSVSDTAVSLTVPRWVEPASAADVPVDVVVTSAGLGALGMASVPAAPTADDYTYLALPAVTGLRPPRGPAFGGTPVVISGTGLDGATEVRFGDAPATKVIPQSPVRLVATAPPHAVGSVPVTVTTPARGASVPAQAPQFTYHPGISGIFPPTGPTTGGTEVTIAGKGLAGTTEVRFGNDPVTFTERSDTELVAVAPPHAIPEAVPVSLVASGLSSLPEDVLYTYGLVAGSGDGGGGGTAGGTLNENVPPPEVAPPGGSPAASPSLSSAPSPVPSGSPAPGSSPAPGGAGAAGASAAPGASPGHAPTSVNAPMGAALPVPLASPVAAPGAAGQGAPGSGQGAVGSEDNDEAQGAQRYAMSDASAGLALGAAGTAGCFSWLAVARRSSRRRRASPAGRPSPKGAY